MSLPSIVLFLRIIIIEAYSDEARQSLSAERPEIADGAQNIRMARKGSIRAGQRSEDVLDADCQKGDNCTDAAFIQRDVANNLSSPGFFDHIKMVYNPVTSYNFGKRIMKNLERLGSNEIEKKHDLSLMRRTSEQTVEDHNKTGVILCAMSREVSFTMGASGFSCNFSSDSVLHVNVTGLDVSGNITLTELSPFSFLSRVQRYANDNPSNESGGLQKHLEKAKIRMSVIGATALPQVYEINGALLYCSFWYSGYYSDPNGTDGQTHDLTRDRLIHDLLSSSGCEASTNCSAFHYQHMSNSQLNTACETARSTTTWCSQCLVAKFFRSATACDQMCWTAQKDTVISEVAESGRGPSGAAS